MESVIDGNMETLFGIIAYLLVMIFLGLWYAHRSNSGIEEYFIGRRGFGPFLAALSAETSDMSGWLFLGLPGVAYFAGLSTAFWTALGLFIGTWINWALVARRLRSYSQIADNAITLPEFFSKRFHDDRHILLILSALICLVFFSIYVGAQFITFGKLFHYTFGADMSTMVVFGGVVVLFYTLLGGFWAVGMTGVIQGVLMVCALALVLAAGLFNAGGINAMAAKIAAVPIAGGGMGGSFLTIVSTLAWGLGYFGMPQVLLRFMAIKRTAMIRPARNIAVIWCFIALASAILIGIAGRAHMPAALPTEAEAENIFILLTTRFFPPLAAGIVLTGILAASMSTCDSQMLIVASSLSNDIFKGVIHKYAGEETVLWIARAAMLITAGFGIVIAISGNQSIFQVVSYAWAGFGASFGPLMLFSLYWKRTTLPAAVAGMLSGGGAVVLWKNLISKAGGVFAVYELLPAFILSSLVIVVVSLLTKKPSPEIEKEFDEAKTAVF